MEKRAGLTLPAGSVYDTTDSVPRQEGKNKIHKSTTFKNIGIGLGGLGLGYAGLKHGNAADAIGKAADEYRKSAPSHMARAAHAKVTGVLQRLRRFVRMSSKLSEIRFAKPGEMFKKYNPQSKWITDPKSRALLEGATATGSTEKHVAPLPDDTSLRSRSKRLSTQPPKGRITKSKKVREHIPPGTSLGKRMSPQREAMMKAEVAADIHGEHSEFRKKRAAIVEAHKYQLENTYKGHPPDIIKNIKEQHRAQLNALDETYYSELRSRPGYGMRLDAIRKGIRKSAATEAQNTRQALQGIRQHVSHSLPAPLPESELNRAGTGRIQVQGRSLNQGEKIGRYKSRVFTGIATRHGKNAPFKLGGKETPNLPAALEEASGKLDVAANVEAKRIGLGASAMKEKLERRARFGIQKSRLAESMPPHPKNILQAKAEGIVHHAVISPISPEGDTRSYYKSVLGLQPGQLDKVRSRYQHIVSPDYAADQAIRKRIIKEGNIFKPVEKVQTYAKLRGLGKGAAIAGGVLGGAYLLKKAFGKKKDTQFEVPNLAQKLKGFRLTKIGKKEAILGGALAGGITAADAATSAVNPDPDKTRAQSAWSGTKRGLLYGGVLAGTELPLRRALMKGSPPLFKFSKKDDTTSHDIAIGAIEGAGGYYTTDRLVKAFKPKTTGSKLLTAGIVGGAATGTIGYGLNRFLRSFKRNHKDRQFMSKMKEICFAKYYPPSTEGASAPYNPKKRLTVAQDRYRKLVRTKEIYRKESNLAKSAVAGAALGGLLHGKAGAGIGAAAGIASSAALTLRNRKTRDPFGEESISAKRVERIPYQAPLLGAAGILAYRNREKIPFLKKLSAKGNEIRFAMTPEERERRRQMRRWEPERLHRRGEELYTKLGRAYRLTRDVSAKIKGTPNLDVRGRERTPEWKKQWAVRGAAVGALVLGYKYRGLAKRALHTPLGEKATEGVRSAMSKSPWLQQTVKSAREYGHGVREEWRDLNKAMKAEPKSAAEAVKEYQHTAAEKVAEAERRRQAIKKSVESGNPLKFKSKLREVRFAQTNAYWDIRDERGRSARIYAPGHQQRTRRQKKWHERKRNRDLIAGALGLGGLGAGAATLEIMHRTKAAEAEAAKAASKVIRPNSFSPLESLYRQWNPIKKLSAKLDELIAI